MSIASTYAAAVAAAKGEAELAAAAKPPILQGPEGTAEVTESGGLRISPGPALSAYEIPADNALLLAQWIVDTFGG